MAINDSTLRRASFAVTTLALALSLNLMIVAMHPADAQPPGAAPTTAQVLNALPRGTILLWSATTGPIPPGYFICDGSNGTPNLVNRFVMGAANLGEVRRPQGSSTGTVTVPSHSHDLVVGRAERALRVDGGNGVILHTTVSNALVNGFTAEAPARPITFNNTPASVKILFIMKG